MMDSKVLQEGILDVKIPRGSENRKLWKAWRRQWIGFSVVYPSGRREPYLTLKLSRSSTETPGNPIRICRDGLRLFRCRSKSRPYRTWAIMSDSKPLLFFAAETEVQAQEWMQSVRDGLWPPCFSFQMLTACSYEISLIDDDNTFRSGLLGVYGRMVLSEDVLSLIHPHWGAALLQISLGLVQDVRLVRYAEIPPAGVFCIELKEAENSSARTFTFYSSTATDAIQWILSKMYSKAIEEHSEFSRNKTSSNNNKNSENLSTPVLNVPYTIDRNATNLLIDIIDTESEYEIPISLSKNFVRNGGLPQECASLNSAVKDEDGAKVTSKQNLITQSKEILADEDIISGKKTVSKSGVLNPSPSRDTFPESSSYGKVITSKTVSETTTYEIQDPFYNLNSNEYANINDLNKNDAHKTNISFLKSPNNARESPEYAIVNKIHNSKEAGQNEWADKYKQTKTLNSNLSTRDNNLNSKKIISLDIPCISKYLPTFECETPNLSDLNFICGKTTILDDNTGKDQTNTKSSNIDYDHKIKNPSLVASDTWDFETYGKVNKQFMSKDFSNHTLNTKPSTKETLRFTNSEIKPSFNLPNIPSDLLDTSINSKMLTSKNEIWSLENDAEFLPPCISDEYNDLEFTSNIYEHLQERKGTVYEEIDESDEEFELQLPPELPKRPSKLEIPDSLRLQKLSASINETLTVMKTTPSQSPQYSRPHFVKKIKEIGRIMHVGPSQEIFADELNFTKTLQIDNKNIAILKPSIQNVEVQAEAISKPCSTDASLQLSIKHQQPFI